MSLYRVCCAASRTGIASAANNVIAVMHVNVLDFMLPPCVRVCEGPVQSKLPQERSGWVRLSERSLSLKRLVSRQIVLWMPCQTALSRQRITTCPPTFTHLPV